MTIFRKVEYIDAVIELVGDRVAGPRKGPLSELRFYDNQRLPTEEQIQTKLVELQAEYDANEYQRQRAAEYPSWQEQLDMQYWDKINGTNNWQEAIQAVKTKHPNPE